MNRKRLTKQLKQDEGLRLEAYQDSEDWWTIGYGRLIDTRKGGKISEDEAEYMLNNDIDNVINAVIREFPWFNDLSDVRREVVLNMVYNLGLPKFKGFRNTITALQRHDWTDASREMLDSLWSRQVGNRAIRLSEAMRTGQWREEV